jgi:hypothetical protein
MEEPMMEPQNMVDLLELLQSLTGGKESLTFEEARLTVTAELDSLVEQGKLSLGADHQLAGEGLACFLRLAGTLALP